VSTGEIVLFRTHYRDSGVMEFIERLDRESGARVIVVADERKSDIGAFGRFDKISLTEPAIEKMGLLRTHDVGWRCGDYCFYAALEHIRDASHVWLIEPDVHLNFDKCGDFFSFFRRMPEVDLLGSEPNQALAAARPCGRI
jgi:hypothetical protein